jgi:lipopolysaccharide/colanic/teichoic acid biosynthesis glycosyltransferase
MKRAFDFIIAFLSLIILSPILLFVAILIRIDSAGSIIFRSERIGLNRKLFSMYKFRTMIENPNASKSRITQKIDDRITRFGHILRKYKVDELPQLFNVLKGEMSLIGPRAEDPYYVTFYTEGQLRILDIKPGITSPASIYYHNEEKWFVDNDWEELYLTKIMPEKINIDLNYFIDNNILTDFVIILKTIHVIFQRSYTK